MKSHKILTKILGGSKNIAFGDMVQLVKAFGFELVRVNGSHHIFTHPALSELVNLQEVQGQGKAVPGSSVSAIGGTA
ncbi:type II toxin-antitoxin system HicA family toxin [Caldilinea sp.]|uniref:type II toxin-antitoxin system HicA family toxin n=1 Tax=Caldilinea sp. TaxID=2293560 RepID=UPI002CD48FB2|nr:type II toxin-antitoxin system HicA family toxin [Caldilinea sp.]